MYIGGFHMFGWISSQHTVTILPSCPQPFSGDLEIESCKITSSFRGVKTRTIPELGVWHGWKWVR